MSYLRFICEIFTLFSCLNEKDVNLFLYIYIYIYTYTHTTEAQQMQHISK